MKEINEEGKLSLTMVKERDFVVDNIMLVTGNESSMWYSFAFIFLTVTK